MKQTTNKNKIKTPKNLSNRLQQNSLSQQCSFSACGVQFYKTNGSWLESPHLPLSLPLRVYNRE